jgi:hypothetical protein
MEYKNSGGAWTAFSSLATASAASPISSICSGVATASQTLYPLGFGGSLLTCTDTTENLFTVITSAGTIRNLYVFATAAGKTANSGVVTVRKNAGDTTLTCTVGVGTTCNDTTHTFTVVAGDRLSAKIVTDAGETLANLSLSVEKW